MKAKRTHTFFSTLATLLAVGVVMPTNLEAAPNLVRNGDFETVDPTVSTRPEFWSEGFVFPNTTTTYAYPHTGVSGSGASVSIESTNPEADAKWFHEPVAIVPGTTYHYKTAYQSTDLSFLTLRFADAFSNFSYFGLTTLPASTAWTTAEVVFTAPSYASSVTMFHSIKNGTLSVDDVSLSEQAVVPPALFNKGVVTLSFDDGWHSQYTEAVPVMNAARIPASFHIISNTVTNPTGYTAGTYMTAVELTELQNAGHEISAHTVHHCNVVTLVCPNPALTVTSQSEILDSRTDLQGLGFSPVDTFVYPYGAHSSDTDDIVRDAGFVSARTVDRGFNTKSTDLYTLKIQLVDRNQTEKPGGLEEVKGWIDSAIQNKTWLILTFHQVEDASAIAVGGLSDATTPLFFNEIVDYLAAKRNANDVVVKTLHGAITDCMATDESNCVNPSSVLPDTVAPTLTLSGANPLSLTVGTPYTEFGATALDDRDGNLTSSVIISGSGVNTNVVGTYQVEYRVTDTAQNETTANRRVEVVPVPVVLPTCARGTHLENNICVKDKKKSGGGGSSSGKKKSKVTGSVLGTSTTTLPLFTRDIRRGERNADVLLLQKRLTEEGFYVALQTGLFGQLTENAVRRYQSARNLPPTGMVEQGTRAMLNKKYLTQPAPIKTTPAKAVKKIKKNTAPTKSNIK
jgi:peptidoglycan/xylan/chitin deacetylase (PgdA/CDA1 family)